MQVADLPPLYARLAERGTLLRVGLYASVDGMQCLEIMEPRGNMLHVSQAAADDGG